MKKPYIEPPDLGTIISDAQNTKVNPPHKSIVLFFEKWWGMNRMPATDEYRLLYIALTEILPKVEWPKEEFTYWVNHKDSALITKFETFDRLYLKRFGPMFDAIEFVHAYKAGNVIEYVEKISRRQKANETKESVIKAMTEHPEATHEQIAEVAGVTRRRVSQIIDGNEKEINLEPKLLNHGANQHSGLNNGQVLNGGNSKDYVIARLERDGKYDLATQVRSGSKSARQASIEAGFKVPESQLTILKRAWKKASEVDRQSFKLFIEEK